jgi:hypothetical protein
LAKYKDNSISRDKYIVYKRDEKEPYEKKFIGQSKDVKEVEEFFNKFILKEDSIKYDAENYIEEARQLYEMAFSSNDENLMEILNAVGSLYNLIMLRICEVPFAESVSELKIDEWLKENEEAYPDTEIPLSIIGRYKLHSGINSNGIINKASFYEYLFNGSAEEGIFAQKQRDQFDKNYSKLKERLQELLVNRDESGTAKVWGYSDETGDSSYKKGEVAFFASWHKRAGTDVYFDKDSFVESDNIVNCKEFGLDLFDLLIERFESEDLVKHIKKINQKIMLVSWEFPSWGVPTSIYDHPYILTTSEWFTAKCINLDFIKKIQADSLERYRGYLKYFLDTKKSWQNIPGQPFAMFAMFEMEAEIPYNQDILSELFELYYTLDVIGKKDNYIDIKLNFVLTQADAAEDEVVSICPEDYRKFIKDTTGIEVSIAQRGKAGRTSAKQIIYMYNNKIYLLYKGDPVEIASIDKNVDSSASKLVILSDEDQEWKKAICTILEFVKNDKDIVEKCSAYIPNNQCYSIQGEKYNSIADIVDYKGNIYSRRIENGLLNSSNMKCEDMKRVITARGNNNNRCGCCGNGLNEQFLIIVQNSCEDTKEDYPSISNVVCSECYSLLTKSHKDTNLRKKEDGSYVVEHSCTVQNTHQKKDIKLTYRVCDGIRLLWKKA